jgi:prepilin peptidase CpaA
MLDDLSTAAFVALVVLAAVLDIRTRRIPNALTVSGLFIALALRSFVGSGAVMDGLQGAGLAMLLVLPLFTLGALGGGDLKLLVAVGAFLGPWDLLVALLVMALAGGILALGETIRRGVVLPLLLDSAAFGRYCITFGRSGSRPRPGAQGTVYVPYGVAIAAGSLAAWFLPLKELAR